MSKRICELEIHNNDRLYREVLKDYFPPRLATAILGESGSYGSGIQRALRGVVVAHIELIDSLELILGKRIRPDYQEAVIPKPIEKVEVKEEVVEPPPPPRVFIDVPLNDTATSEATEKAKAKINKPKPGKKLRGRAAWKAKESKSAAVLDDDLPE